MDLSLVTNPPCVGLGPKARRTFDHERGGARRADVRTVAQGQRQAWGGWGGRIRNRLKRVIWACCYAVWF